MNYIGGMYFFNRKKNATKDDEIADEHDTYLCKFVTDGSGKKLGESISLDDDILILKSKGRFLGIPLKHVENNGKTLLVKGLVDFDKAYDMGENWREKSFNEDYKTTDSSSRGT